MAIPRKSSSRSRIQRMLLRAVRRLSAQVQAGILIAFGIMLGGSFMYSLLALTRAPDYRLGLVQGSQFIIPEDKCGDPALPCYIFSFTTGRSGTQHLSRVVMSDPKLRSRTYITHEEEHFRTRTKLIVENEYRRIAAAPDEVHFRRLANDYVSRTKIRFYNALLKRNFASRLVYTGHVPMVFGLGHALIENLPSKSVRVLRMRRERIATALSLMALGPESEDPWGATNERDESGKLAQAPSVSRRWFPKPTDAMIRLDVAAGVWEELNRFQRWLWYVDDVECRWQALRRECEGQFSWLEVELESLNVFDGGVGWERVAQFMGVSVNWSNVAKRDNSIQHKMRSKSNVSEAVLRMWDVEYRRAVGACRVSDKLQYKWDAPAPVI